MIENSWSVLLELAQWLLLGMGVAGLLHVVLPDGLVARQLRGTSGVAKAVALGVPLPLCSCGVIPAGLGLKQDGASDGASVGFIISTPQTGVDSILVCASFLGWPFALYKVAVAGGAGLLGGLLTEWFGGPRVALESPGAQGKGSQGWRDGLDHALFVLRSIYGWLVFGVVASAAIQTWLPPGFLGSALGGAGVLASLAVLAVALPLYVCATASVPIAAALVAGGMPVGAALIFLMAGPATNVATMGAILRGFGKRILGIYLGTIVVCSVAAAQFYEQSFQDSGMQHTSHGDHTSPVAVISAVILVALLGRFAMDDIKRQLSGSGDDSGPVLALGVEGMTCGGCVSRLTGLLEKVEGVSHVEVVLEPGQARVYGSPEPGRVEEVIRNAGFQTA